MGDGCFGVGLELIGSLVVYLYNSADTLPRVADTPLCRLEGNLGYW